MVSLNKGIREKDGDFFAYVAEDWFVGGDGEEAKVLAVVFVRGGGDTEEPLDVIEREFSSCMEVLRNAVAVSRCEAKEDGVGDDEGWRWLQKWQEEEGKQWGDRYYYSVPW